MTQPDDSGAYDSFNRRRRVRLALRAGIVVSVLGVLAVAASAAILLANDNETAEGEDTTASARPTATSTLPAPTSTPRRNGTPTPAVTEPAVTPNPSDIDAGGDQPSGPLPDTAGNIPENVNVTPEMLALRDALAAEIADYSSGGGIDVGIAVTDLQTGETISINGNTAHKTGCVINMYALLATVNEFQAGNASPGWMSWSIKKGIGGSYPPEVKNFLEATFGSYVSGTLRARELMTGWGLKTSYMDHVPYYGGDEPGPNIATALETNGTLQRLWQGKLFNEEWTQYTIGVLRDSFAYADYILPKWLPWTATTGHKIGYHWDYDGWVNNDVGIVSFTGTDGNEKAYAISYFSQYAPSEFAGYSFGARLSLVVWNHMAPRYGLPAQPDAPYYPPPPPPPVETPTEAPADTPQPTDGPTPQPTATPTAAPSRTPSVSSTFGVATPTP